MSKHFIHHCIMKNYMSSCGIRLKADKEFQDVENKVFETIFQDREKKEAFDLEVLVSRWSARGIELAYEQGMQDMFQFYMDFATPDEADRRIYEKPCDRE